MLSSSFAQVLSFNFTVSTRVPPKNALLWDGTENLLFISEGTITYYVYPMFPLKYVSLIFARLKARSLNKSTDAQKTG